MNMRASDFLDETAEWRARVAAEVATRYGVPVAADVVSRVAMGDSGIPALKWNGHALVYDAPVTPWRAARRREYNSHAHGVRVSTGRSVAAQHRRDEVARLHGLGLYDAQIMAQLGISLSTVRNIRYDLELDSNGHLAQQDVASARVARVLDMLQRGFAPKAIAASEGLKEDTVKRVGRERLSMQFPRSCAPKLVANLEAAQQKDIARAKAGLVTATAPRPLAGSVKVKGRGEARKRAQTARQADVAALTAEGLSQRDIANRLGVSRRTISHDLCASGTAVCTQRGQYHPRLDVVKATTQRRAEVLRYLQQGEVCGSIARLLGYPQSTVRDDRRALIVCGAFEPAAAPPPPWVQRQAKVLVMLRQGMGRQAIAEALEVGVSTIRDDRAALIARGAFQSDHTADAVPPMQVAA